MPYVHSGIPDPSFFCWWMLMNAVLFFDIITWYYLELLTNHDKSRIRENKGYKILPNSAEKNGKERFSSVLRGSRTLMGSDMCHNFVSQDVEEATSDCSTFPRQHSSFDTQIWSAEHLPTETALNCPSLQMPHAIIPSSHGGRRISVDSCVSVEDSGGVREA